MTIRVTTSADVDAVEGKLPVIVEFVDKGFTDKFKDQKSLQKSFWKFFQDYLKNPSPVALESLKKIPNLYHIKASLLDHNEKEIYTLEFPLIGFLNLTKRQVFETAEDIYKFYSQKKYLQEDH